MNRLKILLADDHETFRRILSSFLRAQPGIELVGEAVDGREAIEKSNQLSPDLVLIDIRMPGQNGIKATRMIKVLHPHTKVVMMSLDASEIYQRSALQIADGYLPKASIKQDLTLILDNVMSSAKNA